MRLLAQSRITEKSMLFIPKEVRADSDLGCSSGDIILFFKSGKDIIIKSQNSNKINKILEENFNESNKSH